MRSVARLFQKAVLTMPNGKTLTIEAANNSATNIYLQSVALNGKPQSKTWLTRGALSQGGTVRLRDGRRSRTSNGASPKADAPFSISAPWKVG
jgi:putative alpha-1,2-mannosidase